ncbi:MAG: 30S ribosome-binding factor RbfA [Alphaproteobacteria bacterium]|nr:MAG: 30S ribosome-binding factor RbfA [Alphaproteobacteria bacterium]
MTRKSRDHAPSVRMLRVGESLRHAIAGMLARGEVHDDLLSRASITVSEVRLSADLRHATAFVMPLAGVAREAVLAALNRAAPALQGRLGRTMRMKFTPRLVFRLDESFDEASRIDRLLADPKVRRDLDPADTD